MRNTPPTVDAIVERTRQGQSYARIAQEFGVNDSTITRTMARAGLSLPVKPPVQLPSPHILRAELETEPSHVVAARYGVSASTIRERMSGSHVALPATKVLAPGETVPDWPDAHCNGEDPELFFPEVEQEAGSIKEARRQARVAQRVCAGCPRLAACFKRGQEQKYPEGVWGGVWFHAGRVHETQEKP